MTPMSLTDPLPIMPFTRPVRGEVALPGSKSITNRALLLSALCDGPVTLTGALFSEDTRIMADALRRLGIMVGRGRGVPVLRSMAGAGAFPRRSRPLRRQCGNRGPVPDGPLRRRSARGLPDRRRSPDAEAADEGADRGAAQPGSRIRCPGEEGFFPASRSRPGVSAAAVVRIDASESSQMLSALFMVAPLARRADRGKLTGQVRGRSSNDRSF